MSQFLVEMVRQFLVENVKADEVRLAKQQAADALNTDVVINDPAN